jgi:mRNA interferase MazF
MPLQRSGTTQSWTSIMTTTPPRPRFSRVDVILVVFPNSDLRTAKLRPALIVQADNLQTGLSQVIVAMISSNLTRANHTSRVLIRRTTRIGRQAGLLTDSVVMTDNLATILEPAIDRVIGNLPMQPIDVALRHTLGL